MYWERVNQIIYYINNILYNGKTPKNTPKPKKSVYRTLSKYIRKPKSHSQSLDRPRSQGRSRSQGRINRSRAFSRNESNIREFQSDLSEEIRDQYNVIASRTHNQLLNELPNPVHFIFLFAGNAYVEQIFVSLIRSNNIIIESICFVDLHYNENEMRNIRRGFPGIHCRFYGIHNLDSIELYPNTICLGIRPQIVGNTGSEINRFIDRYNTYNRYDTRRHYPIYLVNYENLITINDGETINDAISRLHNS